MEFQTSPAPSNSSQKQPETQTELPLSEAIPLPLWQRCLRENRPIEDFQTDLEDFEAEVSPEAFPACAPIWAGGKGKPGEVGKPWTWEDMEMAEQGVRAGTLLACEIAIIQGRTGCQITKFLSELKGLPKQLPSPSWIPDWARCFTQTNPENLTALENWDGEARRALEIYWALPLLGSSEIAQMIGREHEEILKAAKALNLPTKATGSTKTWCGVKWEFQPDTPSDPKLLDPDTQYLVAQTSATRFSMLYEKLTQIEESHTSYKKISAELDKILRLHTRIFEKFVSVRSRKYNQCSPSPTLAQEDLEQAGKTAIFECLRRWHPDRNIRFSRGAVCIAITREMIAWLEAQRLIPLPDKIRALARKLKAAHDSGKAQIEYDRLVKETNKKCVAEAAKHQNNYAYITTVPLMDTYSEEEAENGATCSGTAKCLEGFETTHTPDGNIDLNDLLLRSTEKLTISEKRAVLLYHGLSESGEHIAPMTLEEIGAIEGVTKERIRQRIGKAKERMRRWMECHQVRQLSDAFA